MVYFVKTFGYLTNTLAHKQCPRIGVHWFLSALHKTHIKRLVLILLHAVKIFSKIYYYYLIVQSRFLLDYFLIQSKKKGKDQESIQPSITPDPGYHNGK